MAKALEQEANDDDDEDADMGSAGDEDEDEDVDFQSGSDSDVAEEFDSDAAPSSDDDEEMADSKETDDRPPKKRPRIRGRESPPILRVVLFSINPQNMLYNSQFLYFVTVCS